MAAPSLLQPADARDRLGPESTQAAWRWLAIALLGLVVGYAAATILSTIGASLAGTPGGVAALTSETNPPVWFETLGLVGLWIGFGGAAFVATRSHRSVGLSFRGRDAWCVLLGVGLQVAVFLVYLPFHPSSKGVHQLLGGSSGWWLVVPACMTVFLAPLFEELYFRGVLLRGLLVVTQTRVAIVGVVISVLLDASVFGLLHLGSDTWYELPGLVALGVVLCALAIRSGRLGPSIVTHASFNLLAVIAFAWSR
jgi:uncharacterized protein